MAQLIYTASTSLDGFVCDPDGNFDWAAPDEELHAFFNDLARPIGTQLLGRRLYQVMTYWETADSDPGQLPVEADYTRIWRAADKIVFSTTLAAATTARTRIEATFDPDAVRRLVAAADRDLSIGGPTLAAAALRAGLVDELHLFVHPIVIGAGTLALPVGLQWRLELVEQRRIGPVVCLRYRTDRHRSSAD